MSAPSCNLLSLLVRHFPNWLNYDEKDSLLRHFGAKEVVIMGSKGKMRNCAFVTFTNQGEAKWALSKLHQLDVFGHRLSVEYAQPAHVRHMQETDTDSWACNRTKPSEPVRKGESVETTSQHAQDHIAARNPSQAEPPPPRYLYPAPNPTILTNITNALACVPQLYVQVLHLMNKLNLPPPFGDLTPTPPLPSSLDKQDDYEKSSDEGSEIASDGDEPIKRARLAHKPRRAPKRRAVSYKQMKSLPPPVKKRHTNEGEVPAASQGKKIALNIPSEIVPRVNIEPHTVSYITQEPMDSDAPTTKADRDTTCSADRTSQKDTTHHSADNDSEEVSVHLEKSSEEFVSVEELRANRMSEKEMKEHPVFKKYSAGDTSMRLYVKNLGKHVEEKDLRFIYGRYVDWSSEKEVNAFDIRLMQSGRMKGQAFIGLPSEELAAKALKETNGYKLHNRPMVVQFGRSTKSKEIAPTDQT